MLVNLKLIFLTMIGYSQYWHVMWTVKFDDGEFMVADGTYKISPTLNGSSITSLRERIAQDSEKGTGRKIEAKGVSITGLTRISGG